MIVLCLLAGITSLFLVCHGYPFLLFATSKDVRIVNVTKNNAKDVIVTRDVSEGTAMDFCYNAGLICWTDHQQEIIQCASFNGTHVTSKAIVKQHVISAEGIACDWVTQKLYWTNGDTNRIEVATLSGKHRKVLFWDDIDQPRAIALVPMKRIMFWTDWGEVPKIERAGMDGSNGSRKVIVSDDIFWPNGLSIDYANEVIYWTDGKLKFIGMVDYDGRNRRKILSNRMDYPYGLTFFQNKFYWTDWKTWALYELDRNSSNSSHPKLITQCDNVPTDVRVYEAQRQPPLYTPCSKNNGGCSHLCLLSPDPAEYRCACPTGVKLLDQYTCANGSQEFLVVVQRTAISKISLDSPDYTIFKLPLHKIEHAIAIDYDPVDDFLYWTDDGNKGIRRANLKGNQQEDLVTTEVEHPDGITVDWISRNLFWTDTGTDRIEVATLSGLYRKVLINKDLSEPRGIAAAPEHGYIFWSDWSESRPKIERANMDGSDRKLLIGSNLGWPNGIALDFHLEKIYWCDAKTDKIESAGFDGSDRREIISDNLSHPFGLSLLGEYLYWTDWSQRSIERVNGHTSNDRHLIADQIVNIMGLKAVKLGDYKGTNPCAVNNGGCNHLCLNLPGNNYTCDCQIGYELTSDRKTCVLPEAFLLFSKKEVIGRISIENNNNVVTLPVAGVADASGLDFDKNDGRIYWTDTKLKMITRSFINGSDVEKIVEFGLDSPQGIAVDWVSHNVYWIDSVNKRIEVARINGTSRQVLVWKQVDEPHSLVVDPKEGYMYWSEWGKSGSIRRAAMDGSEVVNLVEDVGRAKSLTIDYVDKKLYWTSYRPSIESCSLDGSNRLKIVYDRLVKPTGLAQYQNFIYWTDFETGLVEKADKHTGLNRTVIHNNMKGISDILVYYNRRHGSWNKCARNNGECSHLCLPLPKNNMTCKCPLHHRLENKTCLAPTTFLLFSLKNSVHRLVPDTTDYPDMILPIQGLKNVRAIDYDPIAHSVYWIDGKAHAIKRSDADGKTSTVVSLVDKNYHFTDLAVDPYTRLLFWSCSTSDVINVTRIDPIQMKIDSSQMKIDSVLRNISHKPRYLAVHPERGLLFWTDVETEHKIVRARLHGSKITVIVSGLTDVTAIALDRTNDLVYFAFGKQIDVCDLNGQQRRKLISDVEAERIAVQKNTLYFVTKDSHAIESIKVNGGGSSRRTVLSRVGPTDIVAVEHPTVEMLKSHHCSFYNKPGCSHICLIVDAEQHNALYDRSDYGSHKHRVSQFEQYSDFDVSHNSLDRTGPEDMDGEQRLILGAPGPSPSSKSQCVCPLDQILSDDGRTCSNLPACDPEHFKCQSMKTTGNKDCIPLEYVCDGQADCDDGSDERGCPNCGPKQFRCLSGQCIDASLECDRQKQCMDGSDEVKCCKMGEYRCISSNRCIEEAALCNNWETCDDPDITPLLCQDRGIAAVPYADKGVNNYVVGTSIAMLCAIIFGVLLYYYRKKVTGNSDASGDSAGDPLSPKPFPNASMPKPRVQDSVRMSMFNGSTTSNSYDRNHITGASSSSTSNGMCSGAGAYPAEPLNPPPSPVTTVHSRRCCSSTASRNRPYRHYRAINQPPPPTPCSTDVCDESDCGYADRVQTESEYMTYSRGTASECDSEPVELFPPPPTPSSCPPSPSSTYFNPLPPPPSPENRRLH